MPDTISPHAAITYPLERLGRELDRCSPELRTLVRVALDGIDGREPAFTPSQRDMAGLRLQEAVTTRTRDPDPGSPTPNIDEVLAAVKAVIAADEKLITIIDDIRPHVPHWITLLERHVASLPPDGPMGSGKADRSFAEHELRVMRHDLAALLAAAS